MAAAKVGRVTLGMGSPILTADASAAGDAGLDPRVLSGVAVPFGELGRTSIGSLSVKAGAIDYPIADLGRVKVFTEHGRETPVGYVLAAAETAQALGLTFRIAATPAGDAALLEAREHVRDALSVELSDVVIDRGVITSAVLDAVALTALPAYPSARLAAGLDQEEPMTSTEAATAVAEAIPAGAASASQNVPASVLSAAQAPGPLATFAAPAPLRASRTSPSRAEAASFIARAMSTAKDAAQVNAALQDIVPADDAGAGYIRPQWVDELWTPRLAELFLTNAVNHDNLTGSPVNGWRWKVYPQVGPYAGNKAAIPSNKAQTEAATAPIYRLAGGWDVDRIYTDFNTGMIESLLSAASFDLALKVEVAVGNAVTVAAADVAPAGPGPIAAITAAAGAVLAAGAPVTFIAVAPDVFAAFLAITTAESPAWLAGTLSIADGSGSLGGLSFGMSTGLAAGVVIAGNRNAMTHYDTPQIRVQAVNIPNGGIDVALFYYGADLVHNAAGLAQSTMTATTTAAASSRSK
jgi:hypothetical protein